MPSWSTDGQDPAFLAASRMATLSPDVLDVIVPVLDLKPGMRVLEVGCGSGEYSFKLGHYLSGVSFTGLDYDQAFVDFASKRASGEIGYPFEPISPRNEYCFVQGDGMDLPFEDGVFDAVISHTYLTAVPDYMLALAEMCRVCKPGGLVSSVTVMGDDFGGVGRISLLPAMVDPDNALLINRIASLEVAADGAMDLTSGIPPKKVPVSFAWIGLQDVSCKALGQYFCLSDASVSSQRYDSYVGLLHLMEVEKANRLRLLPEAASISKEEWDAYMSLLDRRRDSLLESRGNNFEWDWFGSSALLVCGRVPDTGLVANVISLKDPYLDAQKWRRKAEQKGLTVRESFNQAGPGRCCCLNIEANGVRHEAWGITPPQAVEVAYAGLLGCPEELGLVSVEAIDAADTKHLHPLLDHRVYALPYLWETVSEAAYAGCSLSFFDRGSSDDCYVTVCMAVKGGKEFAVSVSADTFGLSVQLACAYAMRIL